MFGFGLCLGFIGIIMLFIFSACYGASDTAKERIVYNTLSIFCVAILAIAVLICLFTYEPYCCPGCYTHVPFDVRYCTQCGYELIPHCIECGEICRTAFCKLCGTEQ